jgi:hypothetical protein
METPRLRLVFGALRCFSIAVLRRCDLADLPPALERRLIAFPEAQDKALYRVKIARWKWPDMPSNTTLAAIRRGSSLASAADSPSRLFIESWAQAGRNGNDGAPSVRP